MLDTDPDLPTVLVLDADLELDLDLDLDLDLALDRESVGLATDGRVACLIMSISSGTGTGGLPVRPGQ